MGKYNFHTLSRIFPPEIGHLHELIVEHLVLACLVSDVVLVVLQV